MTANLQRWRRRNSLTQVDAAALLGVSQPYLSLLEKGARPLTAELRNRLRVVHPAQRRDSAGDGFQAKLSALGYPGFAHVTPSRPRPSPDALLLSVLARPDVDSRVVEALPWLVRRYGAQLDLAWLVRQAKLQNLQNRLGFVLQTAGAETPELPAVVQELERARLLQEATLCWDSMPAAAREWMRVNRPVLAVHWNVVTTLRPEDSSHAG
jgi:transcriptional regulator with XRE-family HTH domain